MLPSSGSGVKFQGRQSFSFLRPLSASSYICGLNVRDVYILFIFLIWHWKCCCKLVSNHHSAPVNSTKISSSLRVSLKTCQNVPVNHKYMYSSLNTHSDGTLYLTRFHELLPEFRCLSCSSNLHVWLSTYALLFHDCFVYDLCCGRVLIGLALQCVRALVCVCVRFCSSSQMFAYVYVSTLTVWAVSEPLSVARHMWLSSSLSGSFLSC